MHSSSHCVFLLVLAHYEQVKTYVDCDKGNLIAS